MEAWENMHPRGGLYLVFWLQIRLYLLAKSCVRRQRPFFLCFLFLLAIKDKEKWGFFPCSCPPARFSYAKGWVRNDRGSSSFLIPSSWFLGHSAGWLSSSLLHVEQQWQWWQRMDSSFCSSQFRWWSQETAHLVHWLSSPQICFWSPSLEPTPSASPWFCRHLIHYIKLLLA